MVEHSVKGGKNRSRLASFASRQAGAGWSGNSANISNTSSNKSQTPDDRFHHQSNQQTNFAGSIFNSSSSVPGGNVTASSASVFGGATFSLYQCDNQAPSATKELIRQCFLFTNHLLLCTRTKDGKLHLLEVSVPLGSQTIHHGLVGLLIKLPSAKA